MTPGASTPRLLAGCLAAALGAVLGTGCPAGHADPVTPGDKDTAAPADSADSGAGADTADSAPPPDSDGDGVPDDDDCAPGDASVYPGAADPCDGVDNDCDGGTDEDAQWWYPDADGDAHGDAALGGPACEPPAGWIETGGDCDDADPGVNPAAEEACDDGVDNDCDGGGCRYGAIESIGDVATLVEDDGPHVDNNWYVPSRMALAGNCDLDGDGAGDLAVGIPSRDDYKSDRHAVGGELYLVRGGVAPPATIQEAWSSIDWGGTDLVFALSVECAGDTDGDGRGELAVMAPGPAGGGQEAAYVAGGFEAGVQSSLPSARGWVVQSEGDRHFYLLGAGGDADGDGTRELLFTELDLDSAGDVVGHLLRVIPASITGEVPADAAPATVSPGDGFTIVATSLDGDYDGDGLDDLVVATRDFSASPQEVLVYPGPLGGTLGRADAGAVLDHDGESGYAHGWELASPGDNDGDGLDDLAVGSTMREEHSLFVVNSPLPGAGSLPAIAAATFVPDDLVTGPGRTALAGPGDLDGDGHPDLVFYATDSPAHTYFGGVVVAYGPLAGTREASAGAALLAGTTPYEWAGADIVPLGDFDGDGHPDFATGRSGRAESEIPDDPDPVYAGVYLVHGMGM